MAHDNPVDDESCRAHENASKPKTSGKADHSHKRNEHDKGKTHIDTSWSGGNEMTTDRGVHDGDITSEPMVSIGGKHNYTHVPEFDGKNPKKSRCNIDGT